MRVDDATTKGQAFLLRDGDEGAFKELYLSFYKTVLYFIKQYVQDSNTCEDLAQETFFYLWKNRAKIDPSKDYRSYLLAIARSKSLNYLRDEKKHDQRNSVSINDPMSFEREIACNDHVFNNLVHRELVIEINGEISRLPDKQREVMILSRKKYFTNKEIAQKLQINIKTVEYRLMIALKQIRKNIDIF